jgi:hypothetical protein
MAELVLAIHDLLSLAASKDVDARDKPGHDELLDLVNEKKAGLKRVRL